MTVPQAGRAVVDLAKLRDYCLNPFHEDGKHKARVFAVALGLGRADAEWLRERLLESVVSQPAVIASETRFWTLYVVGLFVDNRIRVCGCAKRVDCAIRRGFSEADDLLR